MVTDNQRDRPNVSVVSSRQPFLNARLQGFGATIFAEMSALALKTNAVNLGQGFPDKDGPIEVVEAAIDAIRNGLGNQFFNHLAAELAELLVAAGVKVGELVVIQTK